MVRQSRTAFVDELIVCTASLSEQRLNKMDFCLSMQYGEPCLLFRSIIVRITGANGGICRKPNQQRLASCRVSRSFQARFLPSRSRQLCLQFPVSRPASTFTRPSARRVLPIKVPESRNRARMTEMQTMRENTSVLLLRRKSVRR